jgi:uncharacterized protein with von Willebrand factor type A (vWA) domain
MTNWERDLHLIEFAYNSRKHAATGFAPFYLAYGYLPLTPLMAAFGDVMSGGSQATKDGLPTGVAETLENIQASLLVVQDRLDAVRRLLSVPVEHHATMGERKRSYRHVVDELGEVHFASLTPREVEAMREAIEQLVRRLKDRISRRRAARRRGALDVKKTLRRAAAFQGVPLEVFYRRRPPRKAKIVTLCDVSGSVWSAARFMLNMLYSLQECFAQVRSFIFVAGVEEVSEIFKRYAVNPAIDKILKEARIDYNAATDYGRSLTNFRQDFMEILNRQTTLIIIGDGRCNYTRPEDRILAEMRLRSRRLIWLNPEARQFWYSGDSEMRVFEAVCDEARPCQNLNQLLEFITSLVL